MPTLTPRLSLVDPIGADAPSEFRIAMTANAVTLDNAALILQGTLASRPAAAIFGRYYLATDDSSSGSPLGTMYFDTGSAWASAWNASSRGATNIAASQSTSSASYTTLTTPDQVTGIVLPTNGLIAVWYQATWQESVDGAAGAGIFLGTNPLKIASASGVPIGQVTQASIGGGNPGKNVPLASYWAGLQFINDTVSGSGADVTTGQVVGATSVGATSGGPCYIFAAAGTYTVSVRFNASSGTVTASSRRLWVQVIPFA